MSEIQPLSLDIDDPFTQQAADILYESMFSASTPKGGLEIVLEGMTCDGQIYYGIAHDDRLMAIGALIPPEAGHAEATLDILAVAKSRRRLGLGTVMLNSMEIEARTAFDSWALSLTPLTDARQFYVDRGYITHPHPRKRSRMVKYF